jgi:hypothetical protein
MEGLKIIAENHTVILDSTFGKNKTIFIMAETELGLVIFKEI